MLNVAKIHERSFRGSPPFRFAQVSGAGNNDHASWWTFDDEQAVRDRWWSPSKGQTVLDIGAFSGSYALPALALGARVVCFSPGEVDTEILEKNLSLNPELASRCLVVRDGLYSKDGWFDPDRCVFSPGESAPNELVELGTPKKWQWLKVRSLDSFLDERPGINDIDWMKLDVEGAELEVLRGAERTIRISRPRILIECHEQHITGIANQVHDYLVELGLGYAGAGPIPYGVVSHAFFEAK